MSVATSRTTSTAGLGLEPGPPRLRRGGVRRAVLLPVADPVAAAARLAVPGTDRWPQRRDRLRHRRVHAKMVRRFVLHRREWWPPSKRVLYVVQGGDGRGVGDCECVDADPFGGVAASGVGGDGHGGPRHAGLHAHTDHRFARRRACASAWRACCSTSSRPWPGTSSGAGTCTTRWRCSSAPRSSWCWSITLINGVLVRGFLAGANRVFQPQNTTTTARHRPADRSPNGRAAQRLSRHGTPSASRAATSSPPDRDADELTRRTGRPPRSRSGCTSGLQTADTDEQRIGGAAQRTRAHRRVRPQAAGDRSDHRHRVDQPGGRAVAGTDVQRRHRAGRIAVLLSAELDLVPRRPAEVDATPAG